MNNRLENIMRYTHHLVSRVHSLVMEAAKNEDERRFVQNALQVGGDIGYGTRYIGFAGTQTVEYGGTGARAAVMYLYGIGEVLGAWNDHTDPRIDEVREATAGLEDEFLLMGYDYANRFLIHRV